MKISKFTGGATAPELASTALEPRLFCRGGCGRSKRRNTGQDFYRTAFILFFPERHRGKAGAFPDGLLTPVGLLLEEGHSLCQPLGRRCVLEVVIEKLEKPDRQILAIGEAAE